MGNSNEEIEREHTVEGLKSAFFFNPGSSSALMLSSINRNALQNIHLFTAVKTSGFFHLSTVANRVGGCVCVYK